MLIPWQALATETLTNVIESFVLREGTDYGEQEVPLAVKVEQIRQGLENGEWVLVFSELHETVTILPAAHFRDGDEEQAD